MRAGEDRGRARGPSWAPAPTWGPESGAEQREVFEAIARELEDANRRGRGRTFDPREVLRLPYEHVRRALNTFDAAIADPAYEVRDPAGFLWSALTSPSWRHTDCADYNRAAFREVLAKRHGSSSGETRPGSSSVTSSPRTSSARVDEIVRAPRPAGPPAIASTTIAPADLRRMAIRTLRQGLAPDELSDLKARGEARARARLGPGASAAKVAMDAIGAENEILEEERSDRLAAIERSLRG